MGIFSLPFTEGTNPLIGGIGFAMMLFGFILMLAGFVIYSRAKKEWNLYYDKRDQVDNPDVIKRNADLKKGKIMLIVGVILVVVSLFLN